MKLSQKIEQTPDTGIALSLFSLTLLLRVIYSIYYWIYGSIPETMLYYDLARQVIEQGRVFYFTTHPYFEFTGPVIIWINALTMLVFGQNYFGLYMVTSLAGALVTLFTYKVARLAFDKKTSVFAGLWSAFYIFYFHLTPGPGKDIWMSLFMIFLIYMLVILFERNRFAWWKYIVFINVFVLSFHNDERFFVFTPFLFLYILHKETDAFTSLRLKKTLLYVGLLVVLMVPWSVRNYYQHDKIVIISTRTEKFTDRVFGYEPREHMLDDFYSDVEGGAFFVPEEQFSEVISGERTETDYGRRIGKEMVEAMRRGHLPKPLTGIRAVWSRTLAMLEPVQLKGRYERTGYTYYQKSIRHNAATFMFYGIIFLFSIPGFYWLYGKDRNMFLIFLTTIVIYVLIHILLIPYTNWRYRLPLDSMFIIVGCYGMVNTVRKLRAWSIEHRAKGEGRRAKSKELRAKG